MIHIKNKEKFKLLASCFGVYLYLIIFFLAFKYYSSKIISNKSPIQNFFLIILINLIQLLPVIILYLVNNSKDIKSKLISNFNFKKIINKIFWTIIFSLGLIMIIFPFFIKPNGKLPILNISFLTIIQTFIFAFPEEIIFRWFLQERFERIIPNKFLSTLIVGMLFGIIHYFGINYSLSSTNVLMLILSIGRLTVVHFYLNLAKEKSNSIIVPSIVHTINNLMSFI